MSNNAVAVVIPSNLALPAHLQSADIAAQVAAANAAAAGGIKSGGFPKVSIEGGKFHEVNAGETNTYMNAPVAPGQPALPMMCFEAVVVAANPALVKKFYAAKWQKGDDSAPDCQSNNGITPDAGVPSPQHTNCAQCEQNKWGSKISEATQKETKACSDSKQLVVLPAWFQGWTDYKALGLSVTPAALGNWGKYVQALSGRNIPVTAVVTNVTFDATASFPKLQFAFNRFLTPEEFALVSERAKGDDVKNIVQPTINAVPALPAPTQPVALPAPSPAVIAPAPTAPTFATAPVVAMPPTGASSTPGFVPAPAPTEPPKRTRRTRAEMEAAKTVATGAVLTPPAGVGVPVDMSHIPANIQATIAQVGGPNSPAGKALMAAFPAPVQSAAPTLTPPVALVVAPAVAAPVFVPPTPAPELTIPTAQVTAAGASLADILKAKLGISVAPVVQ